MSLISARISLTHRCTIERDTRNADDANWGDKRTPSWEAHLTDEPCRVWTDAGAENVTEISTVTVVENMRIVLPLGTDVTEQDRIAEVTYRGATVVAGPMEIRAVLRHQDHLELVLVKVS